jgi:hypothetical protein
MTTLIPVIITEEAGRRVTAAGTQRDLEVMLEWVRNNVQDLQGIHVVPGFGHDELGRNLVVIKAQRKWDDERPPTDLVEWDWAGWKAQTFPPAVCGRFIMSCTFQPLPVQ